MNESKRIDSAVLSESPSHPANAAFCLLCPLECGADRSLAAGLCGVGGIPAIELGNRDPYKSAYIARAARHFYEEPPISGTLGSGTIFFSGCNMSCIFCQNHEISRNSKGRIVDADELCEIMLRLEELGSHNINLVTPSPHTLLISDSIKKAKLKGLSIPIVYNTSSYEKPDSLRLLDGLIDIYLPDFKYSSTTAAMKYSKRSDYFSVSAEAVLEMQRQCGVLKLNESGIATRGLIVRHLILPGSVDEARGILSWLSNNLPLDTYISLMSQYTPIESLQKPLNRRLLKREYDRAIEYALSLGFKNIFMQKLSSASSVFTPSFDCYFE